MDTLPLAAQDGGLTRAAEVNIQDSDLFVMDRGQTSGHVSGHCALAHSALTFRENNASLFLPTLEQLGTVISHHA